MATCPSCGSAVEAGSQFCPQCGGDVTGIQGEAQTAILSIADVEAQVLDFLRQETLGDFEILQELGRGGMAMVYFAHDIALNRKVAIKVMSPALGLDAAMSERFIREAQTAASLSHPNIIPVYSVKQTGHISYFVMKFITGRPLDSLLEELGQMPIPMARTILAQVASGLGYGHKRGIVHRDVKPANIMIDEEGWAIVTDFGIAKVESASSLTQTGAAIGTPTYMSPEQCAGGTVGGASDQYSLGVMAYEMIVGKQPFDGETVMSILFAHVNDAPPSFTKELPDCPPELRDAVMRMLEKKQEDRFPSMEDMINEIGGAPLAHDDPVRKQMITLATKGLSAKLAQQTRTPQSPIPASGLRTASPRPPGIGAPPAVGSSEAPTVVSGQEGETTVVPGPEAKPKSKRGLVIGLGLAGTAAVAALVVLAPWQSAEAPAPAAGSPVVGETPPAGVATLRVGPQMATLSVGETASLQIRALDAAGNPVANADVSWSSDDPSIATVSPTGLVSAHAAGSTAIVAEAGGQRVNAQITVQAVAAAEPPRAGDPQPARVAAVSVTPGAGSMAVGETQRFTASTMDANQRPLSGRTVQWRSSDPFVAQVDQGTVTALAPGGATITAVSEGRSGNATVTVSAVPVARVSVSVPANAVDVGQTTQARVVLTGANGSALSDRATDWITNNVDVATVSRSGLVQAVSPGTATITASSEGQSGSVTVTVNAVAGPPEADPREAMEATLQAYSRALESEDIGDVRMVYPRISSDEETGWRTAWDAWEDLRVALQIDDLEPGDDIVRLRVSGTYTYRNRSSRRDETLPVNIQVTMQRRGDEWVITSVR